MKIIWLLFTVAFSTPVLATITLETITGTSDVIIDPVTTNIQIIAGFNGECQSPSTGLCNTCIKTKIETDDLCGGSDAGCCGGGAAGSGGLLKCEMCNTRAVTGTTVLTIPFVSDTTTTGLPTLTVGVDDSIIESNAGVGTGGRFIFTKPWSEICPVITDGCSCEDLSDPANDCGFPSGVLPKTVTLGIQGGESVSLNFRLYRQTQVLASAADEGALTSYTVYPGDEKVYVENATIIGYAEGSKSTAVTGVQVFIGTGSFNNAYFQNDGTGTGDAYDPSVLAVDAAGIDQVVDGLENNEVYHFRTASIDEAGNIYAYMDNAYLKDTAHANACTDPATTGGINGDPNNLCQFAGKPSRVLGLLTEDMNCFVATAAYGSSLDPHIDTFRDFRFKVLLRSELGRKLNYAYYNYGPKMARFIKDREWAQTLSRAVLWPAWGFASLSLYFQMNLWQTLTFFFASVGLIFLGGFYLAKMILRRRAYS